MAEIMLLGSVANGKNAIVDDDDFEKVNKFEWRAIRIQDGHVCIDNDMIDKFDEGMLSYIEGMRNGFYAYKINNDERPIFLHDYIARILHPSEFGFDYN